MEKVEVSDSPEVLHSVEPELFELGAGTNTGDINLLNVGDSIAWSKI